METLVAKHDHAVRHKFLTRSIKDDVTPAGTSDLGRHHALPRGVSRRAHRHLLGGRPRDAARAGAPLLERGTGGGPRAGCWAGTGYHPGRGHSGEPAERASLSRTAAGASARAGEAPSGRR